MLFQTTGGFQYPALPSPALPPLPLLTTNPFPCLACFQKDGQPHLGLIALTGVAAGTSSDWSKAHIPPGIRVLPSISYLEYQCFPLPLPCRLTPQQVG